MLKYFGANLNFYIFKFKNILRLCKSYIFYPNRSYFFIYCERSLKWAVTVFPANLFLVILFYVIFFLRWDSEQALIKFNGEIDFSKELKENPKLESHLKQKAKEIYERWRLGDYSVPYPAGLFAPPQPRIVELLSLWWNISANLLAISIIATHTCI